MSYHIVIVWTLLGQTAKQKITKLVSGDSFHVYFQWVFLHLFLNLPLLIL